MALPHENDPTEEDGQIDEAEAFDLQTGGAYTGANIEVLEGLKAVLNQSRRGSSITCQPCVPARMTYALVSAANIMAMAASAIHMPMR